jgi:hypothetical protein
MLKTNPAQDSEKSLYDFRALLKLRAMIAVAIKKDDLSGKA